MSEYNVNSLHQKNTSFLGARDLSISSNIWGAMPRLNLYNKFERKSDDSNSTEIQTDYLQVFLRIKRTEDIKLYDIQNESVLICKVPEGAQSIRDVRCGGSIKKLFNFTQIFDTNTTQADIFNYTVKSRLISFLNGYDCNILSYGASGSGKTFTIIGTAEEPGIIPRSLEYIFRTVPKLNSAPFIKPTDSGNVKYLSQLESKLERTIRINLLESSNVDHAQNSKIYRIMQQRLSKESVATLECNVSDVSLNMWVSFAEIYNEAIYDLLKPELPKGQSRPRLRLICSNGEAYIKDLTWTYVSSGLEAYEVLRYGLHNLKYAATAVNENSSRSHSIFTLKLVQSCSKEVKVSTFHFCDLAGSERLKQTNNVGQRLKESNNINKSLSVLGRCIHDIRQSQKTKEQKLIPFRESKLTLLFQKALQGYEYISMIVTINPSRKMFDESQHTLNFSACAKDIIVERQKPIKYEMRDRILKLENTIDFSANNSQDFEIEELLIENDKLRDALSSQKVEHEEHVEYVKATYKELLQTNIKFWEGKYNETLERLQEQLKKNDNTVIVIDSSDEEDNVCGVMSVKTINEINELRNEVTEMKHKILTLEKDLEKATNERDDLIIQLDTAENEIQILTREFLKVQEKKDELNDYIQAQITHDHINIGEEDDNYDFFL